MDAAAFGCIDGPTKLYLQSEHQGFNRCGIIEVAEEHGFGWEEAPTALIHAAKYCGKPLQYVVIAGNYRT